MNQVLNVTTGEVKSGFGKITLKSTAIGSCIVVASYDRKSKRGAMAHIMFPGSAPTNSDDKTKYAANAIDELINMMCLPDSQTCNIESVLVGAGNVLKKNDDTICDDNIKSVMHILKAKNILIRASVLGGTKRKSISMNIDDGAVFSAQGGEKEKLLWHPEAQTN